MENFTPIESTIGGLLIGIASAAMLMFHGRIAGISGIVGGVLRNNPGDTSWRWLFIGGMLTGGLVMGLLNPDFFAFTVQRSTAALVVAGLLVGFGTRLGNGCTSGHGVCGLSRFSARSLGAVTTFMVTAAITVTIVHFAFGGAL